MKKLNVTKSSDLKESDKLLKSEEDFAGFDVNDEALIRIEKSKQCVKKELSKEKGVPMEQNEKSTPIVNNNHVNNKKKQSKSSVSSPETNDTKHGRSSNKRIKKDDHVGSEAKESLESDVSPSLELTTPTFNLTSTPKNRRSTGRKLNVDISDPIFKLPFEYGWKRELVYRTTGDSTSINRGNRNGDVYYYSPINRKLRSLREIQEQLDLSLTDENPLTIESFTFLKQPIGMNDRSKELIRDANTKLSKEDSFVGVSVKPKKVKTPVRPFDYELSDNENNKSTSKMKIVFKNVKVSKPKSKKDNSNLEVLSSTPEYIAEDWQAIQSSATPKTEDESNAANIKRRNPELNGSSKERPAQMAYMESFNYMVKAMRHVFSYLKVQELLSASRVCTAWHIIAMNRYLWQNVRLKNSMVYDWNKFVETINHQGTISLDSRRMLMPNDVKEFENFWLRFSIAIKKATQLKTIELYRCPTHVVEDIIYSLPQICVLNATSIRSPNPPRESKSPKELMSLDLGYLGQLTNLTELRLKGPVGLKLSILPSFDKLINLKTLSLTSIKAFPKDWCSSMETITTGLEFLEIGDCDYLSKDFAKVLERLNNLTSLRLENCVGRWEQFAQDVFIVIRNLQKLRILELINIDFSNSVEDELEKCFGIRALLIIPAYVTQSATTNCHLIDCLKKLSKTLTHFVWGLTHELLRVTDVFIAQYQQNQHSIGYNLELSHTREPVNNIPILRTRKPRLRPNEEPIPETEEEKDKSDNVDILSVPALEKLLETMMLGAKTKVIKIPFSGTTRVNLAGQFNDL